MKKIATDVINFLSGKKSLTSSVVYRIEIFMSEQGLNIDIYFKLIASDVRIKLTFSDIKKYSFSFTSDHYFYTVEIVKFFRSEQGVYISLDPADEDESISSADLDYILCDHVEGFMLTL